MLLLFLLNQPPAPGPRRIRSLTDVVGLERLSDLCARFKVTITAHGSLLRHLVARLSSSTFESPTPDDVILTPEVPYDLFDLVPFASDIDLYHSGPDSLTDPLRATLLDLIPSAECFRWQLISSRQNEERMLSLHCSALIPANLLTLSTASQTGIHDPWRGISDIRTSTYRFIRNGFYSDSPLFRQNRDLELFSALHYFRVLLQSGITNYSGQPGFADAVAVLADAINRQSTANSLQSSPYLRARLRYLMCSLYCASQSDSQTSSLFTQTRLHDFINYCISHAPGPLSSWLMQFLPNATDTTASIVVSNWLGADTFRCKSRVAFYNASMRSDWDSPVPLATVAGLASPSSSSEYKNASPLLAENHVPLLCSEDIAAMAGVPMCSSGFQSPDQPSARLDEMLHVALKLTDPVVTEWLEAAADSDLTCLVVISDPASKQITAASIPTVVHFGPRLWTKGQWLYMRLNCFGVLQAITTYASAMKGSDCKMPSVQLLLVRWQSSEKEGQL